MARTFRYSEETNTKTRRESQRQPRAFLVIEEAEHFIRKEEARGTMSRSDRRWTKKMAISDMDS